MASTQNQALNALMFLYRQVLEVELGALGEVCAGAAAEAVAGGVVSRIWRRRARGPLVVERPLRGLMKQQNVMNSQAPPGAASSGVMREMPPLRGWRFIWERFATTMPRLRRCRTTPPTQRSGNMGEKAELAGS